MTKKGRNKKILTPEMKNEVDEIIKLKIKDINGVVSKLTFNSVWEFNKKIAHNPEFLSSVGQEFNYYSSDFWAAKYKNKDNYGRERIAFYKNNSSNKILFDGEFNSNIQDIVLLVQKFHNKPDILIKHLERIYLKQLKNIAILENSNNDLEEFVNQQNNTISNMENAMYNIFFASSSDRNSLRKVMSLQKTNDWFVEKELQPLVNYRKDFLELIKPISKNTDDIIDIQKKRTQLENEGF